MAAFRENRFPRRRLPCKECLTAHRPFLKRGFQNIARMAPPSPKHVLDGLRLLGPLPGGRSFRVAEPGKRRPRWVLKPIGLGDPAGLREGLRRDFADLASLRHPSLAMPESVGFDRGRGGACILRPYIDGADVARALAGSSPAAMLPWLTALAEALACMHRLGLGHRNLKPANVLVPGTVPSMPARAPRLVVCDPAWWPEGPREALQASAPAPADADLLAAGAIVQGLLDACDRIPSGAPRARRSSARGGELAVDLERIARKLAQPDAARNYRSFDELSEDLRRLGGREAARRVLVPGCFLGREEELAQARAWLAAPHEAALAVSGEAGAGKSAFLERLAIEAQLLGFRTVALRCFAEDDAELAAARRWRDRLFQGRPSRARGRRRRPLLAGAADEISAGAAGAGPRRRIRDLIESIQQAGAPAPTLVLLDEAHRADAASLELLAEWIRGAAAPRSGGAGAPTLPRLAVGFSNETPFRGRLRPLLEALGSPVAAHIVLELAPLPPETVRRWVETVVERPAGAFDPNQIAARLGGHPLAVEEALRRGDAAGASGDRASVYAGFFGALDAGARDLLEALALLGRPASRALLEKLAERGAARARESIAELIESGVLAAEDGRCFFRHGSLQTWLENSLSAPRRRRLHGRIARTLARWRGAAIDEAAQHWLRSESPRRGVEVIIEAARALAKEHEFRRAAGFFDGVLGHLSAGERRRRLDLVEEAAEVHARAGGLGRAAELLEDILDLEPAGLAAARRCGRAGVFHHRAGDIPHALVRLEKGLELLERLEGQEAARERLRVESELAEILANRGDYERAEDLCARALERVPRRAAGRGDAELRRQEMLLLETLAHVKLRRFRYGEARQLFERSLRLGKELEAVQEESLILNNLGSLNVQENRFRDAIRCFSRAARLSARQSDDSSLAVIHSNLAVLQARIGDADAADHALALAAAHESRCESPRARFLRHHSAGMVDLILGRYGAGIESFRSAIALGKELNDRFLAAFDHVFLGECRLFRDESRAAKAVLERALAAESPRPAPIESMAAARLAVLAARRGDAAAARRHLDAAGAPGATQVSFIDASNRIFAGWACRLIGEREAAREHLELAASFFARVAAPAGEIHAQVELAALDGDAGDWARALRRLKRLKQRFKPGQGPLRNPMLAARLLAYLARALLENKRPQIEEAESFRVEAESFLIGRRFLDLESLVQELKEKTRGRAPAPRRLHGGVEVRGGRSSEREALETIQEGLEVLERSLDDAVGVERAAELRRRVRELQDVARERLRSGENAGSLAAVDAGAFVGDSPPARELVALIRKVAPHPLPILIGGETGSGKDLVARALHGESPRRAGPFVSVNCAALPEPLLEAEVFGHASGAFSGADVDRPGLLRAADGGTLLFDEVGELSMPIQAKLLRAIETGRFRPLGSESEVQVDVRYLFATNRDLAALVRSGRFRSELYFRARGFEVRVPSLRERIEDLPLLAAHFSTQAAGSGEAPVFDAGAMRALAAHPWPGNVRELRNVVYRLALTTGGAISENDVRQVLGEPAADGIFTAAQLRGRPLDQLLAQLEREHLLQLHADSGGDLAAMAKRLGITLRALYARFKRLAIRPKGLQ
jgi:DNA-binding NtrC family response regulator/Tfp pilus assembly protein PilF